MTKKVQAKKTKISKTHKQKEIDDILFVKKNVDATSSTLHNLRHVVGLAHTCTKCGDSFSRFETGDSILINTDEKRKVNPC